VYEGIHAADADFSGVPTIDVNLVDGKYRFAMPSSDITVVATFKTDVYVIGFVNDNENFKPNVGVQLETQDGKIYTGVITVGNVSGGYSYFAFTHKLATNEEDWDTPNSCRFRVNPGNEEQNYLVAGPQMNRELPLEYVSGSMQIPAGNYMLTVDLENMTLKINGGTQLTYILEDGVEGVDYTVIDNLALTDKDDSRFFTSNGTDWITLNAGEFFADAEDYTTLLGGTISGVFCEKDRNPYLTLTVAPEVANIDVPVEPKTYSLVDEFAPQVDEVVIINRAYYNDADKALRAYRPGVDQGQSLTIDNTFSEFAFVDGQNYTVRGVINIKNPWKVPSPIGLMEYEYTYPFQNYKIYVLDVEQTPITAIDNISVEEGVKSVRYYNVAGAESTTPFNGVNIVVKEMLDGSKVTTKVVK
jgi:hypothetical protein